MHAFEKHFFARMKSVFLESTHRVQMKVVVDFTNLDTQFPEKDVLLFACKHPIFQDGVAQTQTIISSRICSPHGSVFLFLPRGKYWVYWVEIEDEATEEDIHICYTQIYKNPGDVFEIGPLSTF